MSDENEAKRQKVFDALTEYNRGVVENFKQNIRTLDNQILVLSAGALGLSLTFISDLVNLREALWFPFLILSWVLLGAAILAVLLGLRYATRIKTLRESLDAGQQMAGLGEYSEKGPDPKAGTAKSNVKSERIDLYNRLSLWLFVCGLVVMVTFISINMLSERYGRSHDAPGTVIHHPR